MRSQWVLWGFAIVAFGAVAAPLYLGVLAVVGGLYAGPIAFGVGWAVFRVVNGRQRGGSGWVYHRYRSVRGRLLDYVVVASVTVPVGIGAALLTDLAIGTVLTQEPLVDDPVLLTEPAAIAATLVVSGPVFALRRLNYEEQAREQADGE